MLLSRCTTYENGQLEGAEEMAQWLKIFSFKGQGFGSQYSCQVAHQYCLSLAPVSSDLSSRHMCILTHKHVILKSFQDKVAKKIQSLRFLSYKTISKDIWQM